MSERAMAAWKVLGMVLLVVLPGGSLVLLAVAGYRAWKKGAGPFAYLRRGELRRAWVDTCVRVARWMHLPAGFSRA